MGMKTQSTTVLIAVSILAAAFSVQKQFQTKKCVYMYIPPTARTYIDHVYIYLFIYLFIYIQIILYYIFILYYIY